MSSEARFFVNRERDLYAVYEVVLNGFASCEIAVYYVDEFESMRACASAARRVCREITADPAKAQPSLWPQRRPTARALARAKRLEELAHARL